MFHVRIEGQALRAYLSDCESVTATGSGHDADTVNKFLGAPWQHQPSSLKTLITDKLENWFCFPGRN